MSRRICTEWRSWLGAMVVASLAAGGNLGCRGILGNQAIPEDPLFARRKPVESKAITAAPVAVAFVEPPSPVDPDVALLAARNGSKAPAAKGRPRGNVPGILTSQPAKALDGPVLPSVKPR